MISFQIASKILRFSKYIFHSVRDEKNTAHPLSNIARYDILSMEKEDMELWRTKFVESAF